MNNARHTPGPWTASPVSGIVGSLISSKDGNIAAAMPQKDSAVTEANARLIAAAPELLAALKAARERLYIHQSNTAKEIVAQCDAVIAKAEAPPTHSAGAEPSTPEAKQE